MTTADITNIDHTITRQRATLDQVAAAVRAATNVDDVHDLRARLKAAKAYATAAGRIADLRLDLLRVEVACVIRAHQLDPRALAPQDRKAAAYLADLTPDELDALINGSGRQITTAAGLVRTVQRLEEAERAATVARAAARERATTPANPTDGDLDVIARHQVGMAAALRTLVTEYTDDAHPFTVEDIVEDLITDAVPDVDDVDPVVRAGLRDVVRDAILSEAGAYTIDGTVIPKTLTARIGDDDAYVRLSTASCTIAHLDDTIAIRREGMERLAARIEALEKFRARLIDVGATPEDRIGDVITRTLTK